MAVLKETGPLLNDTVDLRVNHQRSDRLVAGAKTLGNGARYEEIFEANKPMLTHPDKIYPGQMLRIPAK